MKTNKTIDAFKCFKKECQYYKTYDHKACDNLRNRKGICSIIFCPLYVGKEKE